MTNAEIEREVYVEQDGQGEDDKIYKVVVNHEEVYSIWPVERSNPLGWEDVGVCGTERECLDHIDSVWEDIRPRSVREDIDSLQRSEEVENLALDSASESPTETYNVAHFLSQGEHQVELSLGADPKEGHERLRQVISGGAINLKFTETKGGTDLTIALDREECILLPLELGQSKGHVRLVGRLTLDYTKAKCIATIDIDTLSGRAHLDIVE